LDVDRSQRVLVETSSGAPVTRQELWVDGELSSVRQGTGRTVQFLWRPTAGPHTLIARAFDENGQPGRSRPLVVEGVTALTPAIVMLSAEVGPGETMESIAQAAGISADALREANPGLPDAPEEGTDLVVPFSPDQLPDGYRGDDPPPAEPPPAPASTIDLSAEPSGACGVLLRWSGADAESFEVLRFGAGDIDFRSVVDLPSDASQFEDRPPRPGSYLYLVSGRTAESSVESNLARVEVSPEVCQDFEVPPDPAADQPWQFEGLELLTTEVFDRLYCYVGIDGAPYVRLPRADDDFLTSPDGQVWDFFREAGGINRLVFHWRPDRPQPVRMECWGWQGDSLLPLGDLEVLPDGQSKVREQSGGLFSMRADLQPLTGLPPLVPLNHEDPSIPAPYQVGLPAGDWDCAAHIIWGSGREHEGGERRFMLWACGQSDVDVLQWEWSANIDTDREDLTGFRVYVNRDYGISPREDDHTLETWEVLGEIGSALQVYPIPRPSCGQTYGFKVQAFAAERQIAHGAGFGEDPNFEIVLDERASAPSETYPLAAGPCPTPRVLVEVSLDSLDATDTYDECFDIDFQCEEPLEGYGEGTWLRVDEDGTPHDAGSMTFWNARSSCGPFPDACAPGSEGEVGGDLNPLLLDLERLQVCTPDAGCTDFGRDHNSIQVWVDDGDQISFDFALWDHDGASGDDLWCGTTDDPSFWTGSVDGPYVNTESFRIGPFDYETWASFDHETGDWDNDDFPGQRDHAECTLNVSVTAIEVEAVP
jgi:hypothetical protein